MAELGLPSMHAHKASDRTGRNSVRVPMFVLHHENHTSLTAVAVYTFDICEVVVDSEGAVQSQPFKHHLTGRKYDADSY
jgi:hypothetical protein